MTQRSILPTFVQFLHPASQRREKHGDKGQYGKHLIAFIDLLGVQSANKSDPAIREGLLDIFWSLSAISAPFVVNSIDAHPTQDRYWWGPEISAFSDCVVISYPLDRIREVPDPTGGKIESTVFTQLLFITGTLAAACLRQNFLIRGGITIGDLYHSDGTILGPALDEAYEMERTKAKMPLILVSAEAANMLVGDYDKKKVVRSVDGTIYLDHFREMIFYSAPNDEITEDEDQQQDGKYMPLVKEWLAEAVAVVNHNVATQKDKRIKEKWVWFANEFRAAMGERILRSTAEAFDLPKFCDQIIIPKQRERPMTLILMLSIFVAFCNIMLSKFAVDAAASSNDLLGSLTSSSFIAAFFIGTISLTTIFVIYFLAKANSFGLSSGVLLMGATSVMGGMALGLYRYRGNLDWTECALFLGLICVWLLRASKMVFPASVT